MGCKPKKTSQTSHTGTYTHRQKRDLTPMFMEPQTYWRTDNLSICPWKTPHMLISVVTSVSQTSNPGAYMHKHQWPHALWTYTHKHYQRSPILVNTSTERSETSQWGHPCRGNADTQYSSTHSHKHNIDQTPGNYNHRSERPPAPDTVMRSETLHTDTYQGLLTLEQIPRNRLGSSYTEKYTHKQTLTYTHEDRLTY